MSAQEQFDALPGYFVKVDVQSIVHNWLMGKRVVVNHPWPEFGRKGAMSFVVTEVRIDDDPSLPFGRVFVRGENTMWFGQNIFKVDVGGF